MKLNIDKTLLKYVYIVVLATVLYVIYRLISNFEYILGALIGALSGLLAVLTPFMIALVVAYLLHPIVCWIECNVMYNKRITKAEADSSDKHKKLKRTTSVLLTYLLVLGFIVVLLYSSYAMIGGKISSQVDINSVIESLISYSERYIHIFSQLRLWLENSGLSDNLKQQLIDTVESANELISSAISNSFIKIKSFGSNIVNIVLGLILAFYILKDL